ncbi:protein unc-93 homolog A isoform X3 [Ovis aries]|nr:protein unc-93 homolog A isoform X3 [Ovis aries]
MLLSSMFLPPVLIGKLGCKWTLVLAMCCYVAFSLGNFYASWYTLIPTSVLVGLGAAALWSAQGTYLTIVGNMQARKTGQVGKDVVNQYFGIFFLIFQSSGVWGNLISSLVFGQTPTQGTVPEEQLQACGASDCLMAVASTNSTKRPSQDLVYTLMGIYTVLHHLRPGDPVRGLRDDLLRGRRRPVLRALREAGPVHWEDRALRAGGSDPAGLHHCPPAVEAAPQPAARVLRVPRPLGHGRRGLADTEQRSRQVTSWSPTAPGAMKRHGNGTSSTDTWPNSRAKRQPLSAPLGPEPPGETPRPPLSSHFLVAAQPSPPRVRGPFPCPIPPAPPPLSLRYPLQGPGLPGRPLPSDACRQRLWPPRTPAQLSAVTHPPLDRPLSPASPPMGSNPCLHTPAGCPSLTHSRPLLPTGTGPVGLAPGTSSSPALSVAS